MAENSRSDNNENDRADNGWGARPSEMRSFELQTSENASPRPAGGQKPLTVTAVNLASDKRHTRHGESQTGRADLLDSEAVCRQHLEIAKPLSGYLLGDKYRIIDKLGEGAMAIVYRAKDETTGKMVAIKTLKFVEPEVAARFAREVQIHTQLKHANIVDAIECVGGNGQSYFVMELLRGRSIEEVLETQGSFKDINKVADILSQICEAVDYAHEHGVIHRDIKPENIFLCDVSGITVVKVLDFGVAKIQEDLQRLTRTGIVLGSPAYMSPEQCMGLDINHRSDLYSLGVVAYEMVTGELPFDAETAVDMMEAHCTPEIKPIPIGHYRQDIPAMAELQAVFDRALDTEPDARYQTMYHFKRDMAIWWRAANYGKAATECPFKTDKPATVPKIEIKRKRKEKVLSTQDVKSLDSLLNKQQRQEGPQPNRLEQDVPISESQGPDPVQTSGKRPRSRQDVLGWIGLIGLVLGLSALMAHFLITMIEGSSNHSGNSLPGTMPAGSESHAASPSKEGANSIKERPVEVSTPPESGAEGSTPPQSGSQPATPMAPGAEVPTPLEPGSEVSTPGEPTAGPAPETGAEPAVSPRGNRRRLGR